MNRTQILASVAAVAFGFLVFAETQTETTIVEDFKNAFSTMTSENVQIVAMQEEPFFEPSVSETGVAGIEGNMMIPPAIEPAAGGDMDMNAEIDDWSNVPGNLIEMPETNVNIEDQARSGFDNPMGAEDLNAIESAAGDATSEMNSAMGFEDPMVGEDLNAIESAAGETTETTVDAVKETVETMIEAVEEPTEEMMAPMTK